MLANLANFRDIDEISFRVNFRFLFVGKKIAKIVLHIQYFRENIRENKYLREELLVIFCLSP